MESAKVNPAASGQAREHGDQARSQNGVVSGQAPAHSEDRRPGRKPGGDDGSSDNDEDDDRRQNRPQGRGRGKRGSPPDPGGGNWANKNGQSRRGPTIIKTDKFSGNDSFESFIMGFNNAAKYNKWEEVDKQAWLRWSITGPAATILWGDHLSYDEMVEKLRNRNGSKGLESRYRAELKCRRRRKEETLRELCQDISRLMALAFPGEQSILAEHLAQDVFLRALDPDLAFQVLVHEPTGLDDACKKAQQIEVSRHGVQAVDTRDRPYAIRKTRDVSRDEDASAWTRNRIDDGLARG